MIRRKKPFNTLSRRQRRARTQHVKNLIYRERQRCGGLHYDDCDSENAEAIAAGWVWTWSDVLFLGNSPDLYWNAEIITIDVARADIAENLVFEEAHAMLNQSQQEDEARMDTTSNFNTNGKVISHTVMERTRVSYPQFDGLTYFEYIDKRLAEVMRDNPPIVTHGYRIQYGYRSGIGLQIIVEEPVLTREIIDSAIHSFVAGEMPLVPKVDKIMKQTLFKQPGNKS
ncbi:hypothetical protein OJ965_13300 [Pantoea anthophila]|uniref:hypothetical protein n=1 Tax=Pantoea anthophila TaxID=470931 RepID=UPI0022366A46|nr:hypothetical protein [Pantoea anthophila]UZH01689.1 hypothetical protein OJ965_13300 [Pantoea anthophila]